jgi:hypothetical protein
MPTQANEREEKEMSTGTHRKTSAAKPVEPVKFGIPWMHALAIAALVLALFGGLMLAASLTNPVQASTAMLSPAVSAVKTDSFTRYLTTVNSSGMGINPAALPAPAAGPVGQARVAASTTDTVTGTPGQEWAACSAANAVHLHKLEGYPVPSRAWWDAWRKANHADRGMRHDIHHYLKTGHGWWHVVYDCQPDA